MQARMATAEDFAGILQLQAANLYTNLTPEQRSIQGFVTTPFTVAQLEDLLAQTGVFVVEKSGQIGGYALAGSWRFFSQWPIFPTMVARFPSLKFGGMAITDRNSFQYGPVCVDQSLRGTNALPTLFATMRSTMALTYPLGVTFINQANPRSLAAHTRKLNLTVIDQFEFNQNTFDMLAFLTQA
jgi:hypothetical protein